MRSTRLPSVRSAVRLRPGIRWLYALVATPVVTEFIERGAFPILPREWITEVVAGLVIAALVRRIHIEHLAVLALARTDALTGLLNRRAFDEAVAGECARARRARQALCLIYLDVDGFKQVNDRQGHQVGDQVLQAVATALGEAARARVDRSFRLGGDEFALLLPGSTALQATAVLARVQARCQLEGAVWHVDALRLSAGIVELLAGEGDGAFVQRADAAMYRQKKARR
ncbi:MAG: GGDEF domain-containing protein [Ideonella sp.]